MALIHEILYDSGDLSSIDLGTYIKKLGANLMRIYGGGAAGVALTVDADDTTIDIDAMVPCGLAVSELISNCLKHAFPNDGEGSIGIRVASKDPSEVEIVVCDDGVGVPPDFDIRATNLVGMGLVLSLVEKQLGGTLDMDLSQGTCFRISFPPKRP